MAYPDWVLKHKKKGTYINKVGDKYYLYAAHSEHIPGTANKSRRICDGYLGRITQDDGFIPKKTKPSPVSLELGLSCAIVSMCRLPFDRIVKDHPANFVNIILRAILIFIYGGNVDKLYHLSYISSFILFHPSAVDEDTAFLIQRTALMIRSVLEKHFPDQNSMDCFLIQFRSVSILTVNKDHLISYIDDDLHSYIDSLGIAFLEDSLWKTLTAK